MELSMEDVGYKASMLADIRSENYPGMSLEVMKYMVRGYITKAFEIAISKEQKSVPLIIKYARDNKKLDKPWTNLDLVAAYNLHAKIPEIEELKYTSDEKRKIYCLFEAIKHNNHKNVKIYIELAKSFLTVEEMTKIQELAGQYGSENMIDYFVRAYGPIINTDSVCIGAAKSNRLDIIHKYREKAVGLNYIAKQAAIRGHIHILNYIEKYTEIDYLNLLDSIEADKKSDIVEVINHVFNKIFELKLSPGELEEFSLNIQQSCIKKGLLEAVLRANELTALALNTAKIGGLDLECIRVCCGEPLKPDSLLPTSDYANYVFGFLLEAYRYSELKYFSHGLVSPESIYIRSGDKELLKTCNINLRYVDESLITNDFYDCVYNIDSKDENSLIDEIVQSCKENFVRDFTSLEKKSFSTKDRMKKAFLSPFINFDYIVEVLRGDQPFMIYINMYLENKSVIKDWRIIYYIMYKSVDKRIQLSLDNISDIKDFQIMEQFAILTGLVPKKLLMFYKNYKLPVPEKIQKRFENTKKLMTKTAIGRATINPLFDTNLSSLIKSFRHGDYSRDYKEYTDVTKNMCSMMKINSEHFKSYMNGLLLPNSPNVYIDIAELNICAGESLLDTKLLSQYVINYYYNLGIIKGLLPYNRTPQTPDFVLSPPNKYVKKVFSSITNVDYLISLIQKNVISLGLFVFCETSVIKEILDKIVTVNEHGRYNLSIPDVNNMFLTTENPDTFRFFMEKLPYTAEVFYNQNAVQNIEVLIPYIKLFEPARYLYILHGRIYDRGFLFRNDLQLPQDEKSFQKIIKEIEDIEDWTFEDYKKNHIKDLLDNLISEQKIVDYYYDINSNAYIDSEEKVVNSDEKETKTIMGDTAKGEDYVSNNWPSMNELISRVILNDYEGNDEERDKIFGYFITKVNRNQDIIQNFLDLALVSGTKNMINYLLRIQGELNPARLVEYASGSDDYHMFLFFYYYALVRNVIPDYVSKVSNPDIARFYAKKGLYLSAQDLQRNTLKDEKKAYDILCAYPLERAKNICNTMNTAAQIPPQWKYIISRFV